MEKNTEEKAFLAAYKGLNTEQKKAVDTIDGPVMVVAGPGTGKTQVLALRVGNILRQTDIPPSGILCLTFTDAAAVNMRARLAGLIGPQAYKVAIHTFHSFARSVITDYPSYFYNGADFVAADPLAQREILNDILADLPRGDPLASVHDGEFVYLKAVQSAISDLKRSGLTPDALERILDEDDEDLAEMDRDSDRVFSGTIGKATVAAAAELALHWNTKGSERDSMRSDRLMKRAAASLARALARVEDEGKTTPLSEWKSAWTTKTDDARRVMKDTTRMPRMRSLLGVYRAYRAALDRARLYDFDDMLLDVLAALDEHPALLASLEERYQYILVDEFQDTNDAQLALVRKIGTAPVNEGKPNIMVVGDDDQAIFRFQGAEISNIIDFPKEYAAHELVVLTKNYRSTQEILDVAREVIQKTGERLENAFPALKKVLVAAHPDLSGGHIRHVALPTRAHEHAYIAREVRRLIGDGVDPTEIAVITRRHRELEDIASVLVGSGIPISYERQQNVFHEPHIRLLIMLARYVDSLVSRSQEPEDHLLPEILSAPVWGFSRADIWRISRSAAARADRSWLDALRGDESPDARQFADWLLDLGVRARTEPLERMLDEMIGTDDPFGGRDDGEEHEESPCSPKRSVRKSVWKSPFREFYFGVHARQAAEARYLLFLSSLRVFVAALREYKKGVPLFLHDLVEFVDVSTKGDIPLSDTTPFSSAARAVNLMTAHKAKGLEFDTVFVASCQEDVWAGRGAPNKIPFPTNIAVRPEDGDDDRLRAFYVALTRAKSRLILTSYRQDDAGKTSLPTRFILPEREDGPIARHLAPSDADLSDKDLLGGIDIMPPHPEFFPIVPGERAILLELLKDWTMSVTHLNNFLNVARGGPTLFLEQNLLRFPQAIPPASAYGDAMHKAIEKFYRATHKEHRPPSLKDLLEWFREALDRQRITEKEKAHFRTAGEEALAVWHSVSGSTATGAERAEVDFKGQGVAIGGVPLSGKIDKMEILEDVRKVRVTDFKTGRAKMRWEGRDKDEKVTLLGYRRQLIFYKILVEHAHDYGRYEVDEGLLEFIEPVDGRIVTLPLVITEDDATRTADLIAAVHKKVMDLDFPDVSGYSRDADGITQFENDLLDGRV